MTNQWIDGIQGLIPDFLQINIEFTILYWRAWERMNWVNISWFSTSSASADEFTMMLDTITHKEHKSSVFVTNFEHS